MQLFPCPFCGPRAETEFHFGGDLGNVRPEGFDAVSAERWSDYLYMRNNPKGAANEIWMHMTCGEVFRMERDTVNHSIALSAALAPEGEA